MATIKQLGASWENNSIYFVESQEMAPQKIVNVPFADGSQIPSEEKESDAWRKDASSKIKSALKKEKISSSTVNLALPTNDIIFRSFVIPWMQQREIKNVVEFEVCKYIPFSLGELSHCYHPITFEENEVNHIRIIFVAIKNDVMENYVKVLEGASLNVEIIEPSALSLIRALSFKKLIPEDQTIALIGKGDIGRIVVSDKNIPQFVREFYLSSDTDEENEEEPDGEVKTLIKEVRISLDYFNRQNEQLNIEKMYFLSPSDAGDLPQNLESHFDTPVTLIENSSVLGETAHSGLGALNAYGVSIAATEASTVSFNLSPTKTESSQASSPRGKISSQKSLILTALICIPIAIGSIALSMYLKHSVKNEISTLKSELGSFQDAEISFIEQKEENVEKRLKFFQKTRTKSDVSLFLILIPDLLPNGTWIRSLDISYFDDMKIEGGASKKKLRRVGSSSDEEKPSLVLTIAGYAYSSNKGEQFRLVNELLETLKNNEEFSGFFENIELVTINTQKLEGTDVTRFNIVCKYTNENI